MMTSSIRVDSTSIDVHALIESGSVSRPPMVAISFQGLAEPLALWNDLEQLGWIVPLRPPRPAAAIDWATPDGRGNDFTVRPYRVEEFRLQPGTWPPESRSRIGALTVALLRRRDVVIHADEAYLRLLFPAQVEAERSGAIDLRSPADPLPDTLIVEMAEDSMASLCDYRIFGAQSRVVSGELCWGERARPVGQAELRAQRSVVLNALFAWQVDAGEAPEVESADEASLRIIVPDVRQGTDLVTRLRSLMGDRVGSLALSPMAGAVNTKREGLLIVGIVASDRIARVRTVLLEKNPGIIIRS